MVYPGKPVCGALNRVDGGIRCHQQKRFWSAVVTWSDCPVEEDSLRGDEPIRFLKMIKKIIACFDSKITERFAVLLF